MLRAPENPAMGPHVALPTRCTNLATCPYEEGTDLRPLHRPFLLVAHEQSKVSFVDEYE